MSTFLRINEFPSVSGKKLKTYDPRTGNVIAEVAEGDVEDINRAVSAARNAFDEGPWPKMTAYVTSLASFFSSDIILFGKVI